MKSLFYSSALGCCWLIKILKQESTADDGDEESEIHDDDDDESGQVVLAYIRKIEVLLFNMIVYASKIVFFDFFLMIVLLQAGCIYL